MDEETIEPNLDDAKMMKKKRKSKRGSKKSMKNMGKEKMSMKSTRRHSRG